MVISRKCKGFGYGHGHLKDDQNFLLVLTSCSEGEGAWERFHKWVGQMGYLEAYSLQHSESVLFLGNIGKIPLSVTGCSKLIIGFH